MMRRYGARIELRHAFQFVSTVRVFPRGASCATTSVKPNESAG